LAGAQPTTSATKSTDEATVTVEKIGGPGRTRTCNQTVMSADDDSNDVENADEFGEFDRDF
jgi:hypothetical protein